MILVTGAGGFIGGHLVAALREAGLGPIRAVDVKPAALWYQRFDDVQSREMDLSSKEACDEAVSGVKAVYNLAADMGGMGFIEANKARCMLSVLVNTHLLMAAVEQSVDRYFYASSACVYAAEKQATNEGIGLREGDAYPAEPEDGYGWEKLFSERMCRHFREDFGLTTRIARYHNVYGPLGTFAGGREKAPAALCRKIVHAKLSGVHEIEVWGDGEQARSFTYIDDCLVGTRMIMESDVEEPLNLGSEELVTINQLVDMIEEVAGIKVKRTYLLDAPQGVRGRNSDNTLIRQRLKWAPEVTLAEGLEKTYRWIYDEMAAT